MFITLGLVMHSVVIYVVMQTCSRRYRKKTFMYTAQRLPLTGTKKEDARRLAVRTVETEVRMHMTRMTYSMHLPELSCMSGQIEFTKVSSSLYDQPRLFQAHPAALALSAHSQPLAGPSLEGGKGTLPKDIRFVIEHS